MTDLDPTGIRANAPIGLTKEAKRAKRAAERKAFWAGVGGGIVWAVKKIPVVLVAAIVVAVFISATIFDWFMSGRGWQDILPELGAIAFIGAAASVGFWYFGAFRVGEEVDAQMRKPEKERQWSQVVVWSIVAAISYLICVGGVTVATITNTSEAKIAAEKSRREYATLLAKHDQLEEELDVYDVQYWEARLEADQRTARGRLNIAKATLGMADLDVDGGCAQKLNFNQQRACAYWNGGTDPHTGAEVVGILSQVAQDEAGLQKAQENAKTFEEVSAQLRTFEVKTGDKTARALGDYFSSETAGNQVLMIIITFFSAGFLLCGGLFGYGAFRLLVRKGK